MPAVSGPTSAPLAASPSPTAPPLLWQRLPRFLAIVAGLSFLAGAVPLTASFVLSRKYAGVTLPGLRIGAGDDSALPVGGVPFSALPGRVHDAAQQFLAHKVYLKAGGQRVAATWRDLGAIVDEPALVSELQAIGHSGDLWRDFQRYFRGRRQPVDLHLPIDLDEKRAFEYLIELKDQVDRAPVDARLDLERHTVAPERPGYLLRVYESLVAVQYAARELRSGRSVVSLDLSVAETPPQVRREDLHNVDVSFVLASWETRYSTAAIDSDRTYNLKVGADKLNGHILRPGQVFSFNGAVGDRTEKEGYRVAPVIQGGELIDGLAGGMCQIASTLHAASFFAGLDILRTTPHSRPSTYIPMGLDSTVVYPSVDLKLRNPYDFPIVIHYMVNQGSVKVELLGKKTAQHIAFEREILAETKFPIVSRNDPEMPVGQKIIEQEGYDGYRIKRRRYVYEGKWKLDPKNENRPKPDDLIAKKEWDISYPATAQIMRVGTGPTSLKPKPAPPAHHIPAIPASAKPFYYIFR